MTTVPQATDLETHLEATRERRLAEYFEFLRIASISTLPENAADCRAAAEWLAARLRVAGLEHVEVSRTAGHPIVYADWLHADGAPTAIAYGHYDVQPVDPLDEWRRPPFEPVLEDGRVYARGSSDDKSNCTILLQTAEALLATRGKLPINLRFVFEGEEESSSTSLEPWLKENIARLGGDVALICDGGFFAGNVPAITIGLRGLMYAQIDVTGPFQDLHSGSYGGLVENPAIALARIIAGLKDADGRVRIPGFYDRVVPLDEAGHAAYAALPYDEAEARRLVGVSEFVGEPGYTAQERRSARPTLDVNGIWSGFQGVGSKTIIPGKAHAKVSCRLVADQDPDEIFESLRAHVAQITPPGVRAEVTLLGVGGPTLTSPDLPAAQALARALEVVFGRPPVYVREGGSIPFVAAFEELLHVPVVVMGFMPPDGNYHAPNEWMDLANFESGIRAMARYWDELALLEA